MSRTSWKLIGSTSQINDGYEDYTSTGMLTLDLVTDRAESRWAQQLITDRHYLRTPVDARCRPLIYLLHYHYSAGAHAAAGPRVVGCLIFGRPEASRCYAGELTYGSQADVRTGRAQFDRWEVVNLARVWLHPTIQQGGLDYVPNAATWVIGQALRRVVVDYLLTYPPCFLDQPWKLRMCLSYCDTRKHRGTIYRAAGFQLVRTNAGGIETWARPLRGLQGHERVQIERRSAQSPRSKRYRSQRAAQVHQEVLL